MKEYHKIQTVYKRDPDNNHKTLLIGEFATPELEYLAGNHWEYTEKVDGTNIRVLWGGSQVGFKGKTDRAELPGPLIEKLRNLFPADKMATFFDDPVCLYGEGYGAKIQKGGKYRDDQDFVLFDVRVGDWWLKREDVEDIASKLDIDVVPVIGQGTLRTMVDRTREGFLSEWGDFPAEGIVARPLVELKSRNGDRIITKIKGKDFAR